MAKDSSGAWSRTRRLSPGMFQYKFLVDGTEYVLDPDNPATVDNFNRSSKNSVFVLMQEGKIALTSEPPLPPPNREDVYSPAADRKPLYLNILWHQHQPLYVNPATDQLAGPWVRTHATKDYYDMAAMLGGYPDIHCTINLTSSLLVQLREVLRQPPPPVRRTCGRNTIDVAGFMKKWKGKTDPWIDLALTPTSSFGARDKDLLYRNYVERVRDQRGDAGPLPGVPGVALRAAERRPARGRHLHRAGTARDQVLVLPRTLRPGFPVGTSRHARRIGLRSERSRREAGRRDVPPPQASHRGRLPPHRRRGRQGDGHRRPDPQGAPVRPGNRQGQVEIITTPYYHPILPLDLRHRPCEDLSAAAIPCRPGSRIRTTPGRRSRRLSDVYREIFGWEPTGMWPGEGSVAQPVLELLRSNGILWTASDVQGPAAVPTAGPPEHDAVPVPGRATGRWRSSSATRSSPTGSDSSTSRTKAK